MMKKLPLLPAVLLLCLSLTACGRGKISRDLTVRYEPSQLYTEEDIGAGIRTAENYFRKNFSGCTLSSIGYAGDAKCLEEIEFARRNGMDEVMVLLSSFEVDGSGGDGSLNPNSEYTGWMWILAWEEGGSWVHIDHGY